MVRTALLLALLAIVTATHAADPVIIALRSEVSVTEPLVLVGHVADISGGTDSLRRQVVSLDLTKVSEAKSEEISRRHLEIRLLLSDLDRADYRVTGAALSTVRLGKSAEQAAAAEAEQQGDSLITTPIQLAYAQRFQIPVDEVLVELTQPIRSSDDLRGSTTVRPFLPTKPGFGEVRLRVGVYSANRLIQTLPVSARIQKLQQVVTAATEISPGIVIRASHLAVDRQPRSGNSSSVSAESLIGRTARRRIGEGRPILLSDVKTTPKSASEPYVIRTRAAVRIVARKGTLKVYANDGEALQNGRIGDLIRVRNSRSRRIISAKVISSTEVQVSF